MDAEDGFQICLKKLRKKNKYFREIYFIYNDLNVIYYLSLNILTKYNILDLKKKIK